MDKVVWEHLMAGRLTKFLAVALILMVGFVGARLVSRSLATFALRTFDNHQALIVKRLSYYFLMALTVITALNELGINLQVIIGAAGVASVAIGFAAQTSMSNIISGIFMVIEKPFIVGDLVRIEGTEGEVVSMGLFSTILRTPDNIMVRIPNETLMKSAISNVTRFPIRRVNLEVGVTYAAQLGAVRTLLLDVANSHNSILTEPKPMVQFRGFGDNSMNLVLSAWATRERFLEVSFDLPELVKKALDAADIEIPGPQRTLSIAPDQRLSVAVIKE